MTTPFGGLSRKGDKQLQFPLRNYHPHKQISFFHLFYYHNGFIFYTIIIVIVVITIIAIVV